MSKFYFKSILNVIVIAAFLATPQVLYAQETHSKTSVNFSTNNEIITRVNITEYKYMEIDGILYKRLWSYTYGRWEDPYWTLA